MVQVVEEVTKRLNEMKTLLYGDVRRSPLSLSLHTALRC